MPGKISTDDYQWRASNAGRALSNALRRFEERVLGLMGEHGFHDTGFTRRADRTST
jgi:hypothetical protein